MKQIQCTSLLLALMGPPVIASGWIRNNHAFIIEPSLASPGITPPHPTNNTSVGGNTSLDESTDTITYSDDPVLTQPTITLPSWLPTNLTSPPCNCTLAHVPMISFACHGELFFTSQLPVTVFITVTETCTVGQNISMEAPTFITPDPPCLTYSCGSNQCVGMNPPYAPVTTVISVTKKTTIQDVIPTEKPPSFSDDEGHGMGNQPTTAATGELGQPPETDPPGRWGKESGPAPSDGPSDPPAKTQPIGAPNITRAPRPPSKGSPSEGTEPSGSSVNQSPQTIITMAGIPVTVFQPSTSIILGDTPSKITITNNDYPTTVTVDGVPFTVNPSEIICSGTTLPLNSNPTESASSVPGDDVAKTTTSNRNSGTIAPSDDEASISSETDRIDSSDGSILPRPTSSSDNPITAPNAARRISAELDSSLISGIIISIILGGTVGFL
ncbi:hypothetical protein FQN57_002558 [Myotisia sp. PD_48]|nr:hypothetical protein FQN57_002558 [Myotisia sp. PD_48]